MRPKAKNYLVITASLMAFSVNATTPLHNNAHEESNASAIYENWKSTRNLDDDPFYRVSNGYKTQKAEERSELFGSTVDENHNEYLSASYDIILENVSQRKFSQEAELRDAYSLAKDEEEGFDHELYFDEVENYLAEKLTRSELQYEQRHSRIANVTVETNVGISSINSSVVNNQNRATRNLINLMKEDYSNRQESVFNAFNDNIASARASQEMSATTLELAANFSGDCPACSFTSPPVIDNPTPPPEPEPEPEPPMIPPDIDCFGGKNPYNPRNPWLYYKCP